MANWRSVKRHDAADRWLFDGLDVSESAGGDVMIEVDMTATNRLLKQLRERGQPVSYNHAIVRAAALALTRHPDLCVIVGGSRTATTDRVDIALPVAGSTLIAPVMVLEDAGRHTLLQLADETVRRVPEVLARERRDLTLARRFGWVIPFGFVRRALLRWLMSLLSVRRKVGTLLVTCVPNVDAAAAYVMFTSAVLGVGSVKDRVIAVDGLPCVRPTVRLHCTVNHRAWDGQRASAFLAEVRVILEQNQLAPEVGLTAPVAGMALPERAVLRS